ncbi:IS3 family transposase [Amycolatopsis sp. NPDC049868]|uniref:IS3 family transposase n=1 Tax=Amycolatopsis sp. NPDC049868 TaxID=3363934 RepID=UPI0037AF731F
MTEKIIEVHDESNGTYGAPRIHAELADQGHRLSRKRVARLLRQAAITPADLIKRDFSCDAGISTGGGAGTSPTSTPGKAGFTSRP